MTSEAPRRDAPAPRRHARGFSLLELVITISLTGLLAVALAGILRHPIEGRARVQQRSDLVALGDVALAALATDVETALPRSVRIAAGGTVLEFLTATAVGPYRSEAGVNDPGGPNEQDHGEAGDRLTFAADSAFNLLGRFRPALFSHGSMLPAGMRVAVGATDATTLFRAAARGEDPGPITPASTTLTLLDDADEDQIALSTPHTFALPSPTGRAYLVGGPVSYVCDPTDAALWRVDGYALAEAQPISRGAAPLAAGRQARAAEFVERCQFRYRAITPDRPGLVTIELVLLQGDERVRLLQQVEVGHAP